MTKKCFIQGCGDPLRSKGLCRRHYERKMRLGDPLAGGPSRVYRCGWTVADRLWDRVNVTAGDGCWEWTGPTNSKGYGAVKVEGANVLAHRLAFMLAVGDIPAGMFVCHKCDNPACCRPDHLWIGTCADNLRDMRSKGRARYTPSRGGRNGSARLTVADVTEIRRLRLGGMSTIDIAVKFGIGQPQASHISIGRSWRHVPMPVIDAPEVGSE